MRLKGLIDLFLKSRLEELEVSRWLGLWRLRIRKQLEPELEPEPKPESKPEPKPQLRTEEIKSPLVGTFYRSPAPEVDAKPLVWEGLIVKKGDALGIIESLGVLNKIKAKKTGRIVKVLVENGQPVEYDQPIFLLAPI